MDKEKIETHLHKINSALSVIVGYADLLSRSNKDDKLEVIKSESFKVRDYVNSIREEMKK